VHNVDVLSTIYLGRMVGFHAEQEALATLAVQERESARQLLFDEEGWLCGRRVGRDAEAEFDKACNSGAGSGVLRHPRHLSTHLREDERRKAHFRLLTPISGLRRRVEKVVAFQADGCYWRDLGRPESVMQAALISQQKVFHPVTRQRLPSQVQQSESAAPGFTVSLFHCK